MITKVSNIYELNKILRLQLISQTELSGDRILNGLDIKGANLEKRLSEQKFKSFSVKDCFIVFELTPRNSSSNITDVQDDDSILAFSSYSFKVMIYGSQSLLMSQIIKSRFESSDVRQLLFDSGVYIEEVSSSAAFNEFINNTMWLRTDVDISISIETIIEKLSTSLEFNSINKIVINENEPNPEPKEYGDFLGFVLDAETAQPISNITIQLLNDSREVICELLTNSLGMYISEEPIEYGNYTILATDNSGRVPSYISYSMPVIINSPSTQFRNIVLTKELSSNEMRIILTWGEEPYDLDLHLKTNTGYHIYHGNKIDENGNLELDIDVWTQFGPETITIHELEQNTIYSIYVHDFSNVTHPEQAKITTSNAKIMIYKADEILESFDVPTSGEGLFWNVCQYSLNSGFTIINEITNIEP